MGYLMPIFDSFAKYYIVITLFATYYCIFNRSFLFVYTPDIGIMVRVFANDPGDLGSIPGRVIPKTKKWYLMLPYLTLSIIR